MSINHMHIANMDAIRIVDGIGTQHKEEEQEKEERRKKEGERERKPEAACTGS